MALSRKARTILHEGAYWFSLDYAAELLHTTPRKVEALVLSGRLSLQEDRKELWIAEADVTALRRDPAALKAVKRAVRETSIVPHTKPTKHARPRVSSKIVPHTIEPTAPPIVIDPFNARRPVQQALHWTTDRPGFVLARPLRDKE